MYLPYLRCKSEEINCLLEVPPTVFKNTLPVLEPTGISKMNLNKFKKLKHAGIPFILIINPQVNNLSISRVVEEYINGILSDYNNYSLAYIVHNNSNQNQIDYFKSIPNLEKSIIHKYESTNLEFSDFDYKFHIFQDNKVSSSFIEAFQTNNKVILSDGFQKEVRNADYQNKSFFTDKHHNYSQYFIGVGDFLIQGDNFSESGGPAAAVAIHITEVNNNATYLKHFISDNTVGQSRIPEKFMEALNHLIRYANNDENSLLRTTALDFYYDLHEKRHFPGLGMNKRLALMHHLETISASI